MFSWFKKKGNRAEQSRRAFRPVADSLESREVLSAITFTAPSVTRAFSTGVTFNVPTAGMQAANLYGNQNRLSSVGRNLGEAVAGISLAPKATTTAVTSTKTTASSTNAALNAALNAARTVLSSTKPTGNPTGTNTTTLTNGVGTSSSTSLTNGVTGSTSLSTLLTAGNSPLTGQGVGSLNSVSISYANGTSSGTSVLPGQQVSGSTSSSTLGAGSVTFGGSGLTIKL